MLVNSLESLGFLSVFKAYHQDAGTGDGWILQCALSREPIAQHCGTKQKAPGLCRGLLLVQQGCCLPAGHEAGSATGAAVRAAAKDVAAGDKLDPKRTVAFVVRGGTGLAKCIQAVLRRTRRCGGESRQLEDHPRAAIQFLHAEVQRRPFGGHLDLGTRSHVGFCGDSKFLAIAAENDWRPRRCSSA